MAVANETGVRRLADLRILVVEDHVDIAHILRLVLRKWGCAVTVCHDGPSALEAARELQPDVVLLDICLPGMDGHEVACHLREDEGEHRPVIIATTALNDAQTRRRSVESGIDLHLSKPLHAVHLRQQIVSLTGCAS